MTTRDTTMLTAQDVKERMQCSLSQAYRYIAAMPNHFRRGRTVRVPQWAFEEWIAAHLQNGVPKGIQPPKAPKLRQTQLPKEGSFFDPRPRKRKT